MRTYDPSKPLIAIHVPKSAGTSLHDTFRSWFGKRNYFRHAYNEEKGRMPKHQKLAKRNGQPRPICIHGHFNRERGFGIQDYYPTVDQFVTILRDPFDMAVSEYHDIRGRGQGWKDKSRVPTGSIEEHLDANPPNMLVHFPHPMTMQNWEEQLHEQFIYIGITEDLDTSMKVMAGHLGFDPPAPVPNKNRASSKYERPEELRARYQEQNPVEFAVYEFARTNYLTPVA